MKKTILMLLLVPLVIATTCENDDDQIVCTLEAKAGFNVSVRLGTTNVIIADGVSVVATDGSYSEELSIIDTSEPVFIGAWERQGTYIITVSKEGYQTFTSVPITVTADECHVIPQLLEVSLTPQ